MNNFIEDVPVLLNLELDLIADHVEAPVHSDLTAASRAEPHSALLARVAQL